MTFVRQIRIHRCDVCGKEGEWNDETWSWAFVVSRTRRGETERMALEFCSAKCRAEALKGAKHAA